MRKVLLLTMLSFVPFLSAYKPLKEIDFHGVEYLRNYDGDTLTVNIYDLHPLLGRAIGVRIKNIDTPEILGDKAEAIAAKIFLEEILSKAKRIDLMRCTRGKYFRIVCDVVADGKMVSDLIIGAGHSKDTRIKEVIK